MTNFNGGILGHFHVAIVIHKTSGGNIVSR